MTIPVNRYYWRIGPHRQVKIVHDGVTIHVDEGVAIAVYRLLEAGFATAHSCQCDGWDKKFCAYINPYEGWIKDYKHDFPDYHVGTPKEMAEVIGLKKGEYRSYHGVLWFKPFF